MTGHAASIHRVWGPDAFWPCPRCFWPCPGLVASRALTWEEFPSGLVGLVDLGVVNLGSTPPTQPHALTAFLTVTLSARSKQGQDKANKLSTRPEATLLAFLTALVYSPFSRQIITFSNQNRGLSHSSLVGPRSPVTHRRPTRPTRPTATLRNKRHPAQGETQ